MVHNTSPVGPALDPSAGPTRHDSEGEAPLAVTDRRSAMLWLGMGAALAGAYGTFAAFMGRFLYPAKQAERGWMFVTNVRELPSGGSLVFRTPAGATVNVTHLGSNNQAEDFRALSSTCPHLGCQVHWEPQNNRFFCPCHNGVFEPSGKAIAGPPGEAGMSLPQYPVKVENGVLFLEVPLAELAMGSGEILEGPHGPPGPGHDPCLYERPGYVCRIERRA